VTEYQWDWRDRLIGVTEKDGQNNVLSTVEYAYDAFNRRIAKTIDADGPGGSDPTRVFFSWEHDQIVLQFDGDEADDLSHRYLYGLLVDQILADEQVSSLASAGSVIWPLVDHLGTLRDLAAYDSGEDETTIANHRTFDSYGNITAETNAAVETIFAFTGRERDDETGLRYHRARYYDSNVGRWISEDPIGFAGRDGNLSRYIGNSSTNAVDPTGLMIVPSLPEAKTLGVGTTGLVINDVDLDIRIKLKAGENWYEKKLSEALDDLINEKPDLNDILEGLAETVGIDPDRLNDTLKLTFPTAHLTNLQIYALSVEVFAVAEGHKKIVSDTYFGFKCNKYWKDNGKYTSDEITLAKADAPIGVLGLHLDNSTDREKLQQAVKDMYKSLVDQLKKSNPRKAVENEVGDDANYVVLPW